MGKVSKLENNLIHPEKWHSLYESMPNECKDIVLGPLDCLGIGRNKRLGWFIMGSGQGPSLLWSERNYEEEKRKEMV